MAPLVSGDGHWLLPVASLVLDRVGWSRVVCFGFALAVGGNLSLAETWRSGIDEAASEQLVTTLIYAFTRNPTFVGVRLANWGFSGLAHRVFTGLPDRRMDRCQCVG